MEIGVEQFVNRKKGSWEGEKKRKLNGLNLVYKRASRPIETQKGEDEKSM